MTSERIFVSLLAVLLLAVFAIAGVSAQSTVQITDVEVSGVEVYGNTVSVAGFAGSAVPVRVQFNANGLEGDVVEDVRVKAWISGADSVTTGRFDVLSGQTYPILLSVGLPADLDEIDEEFVLNILIEGRTEGELASAKIDLNVQRESYLLEILDVDMDNTVSAGGALVLDVVVKNRGRQFADDSFVIASIPALGISDKAYFGDLSATDEVDPDKEDATERRLALRIPSDAPAGLYIVEIEAFNDDSVSTMTRKVVVEGASADTAIIAPVHSKTVSTGADESYSMTIVNSGSRIRVYELVVEASSGLNVELAEPIVAIPAGMSETVKFDVSADKAGKYNFAVSIYSDSELVKTEQFSTNVEGTKVTGNATVLLTVILAIVFVVLLVVLIVLLTRKPERVEEFGESYY